MNVEVVLSPLLLKEYDIKNKNVVVIDVFRATSTICTALANGAACVTPVLSIEEALSYKAKGFLTGAERDGKKVEGFDMGNSPMEYSRETVEGKNIVLTTTNGTRCIRMSLEADKILIGSFLNLTVLTKFLVRSGKDVVLFCAGWKDKVNMEDSLFAGAVIEALGSKGTPGNDAAEMMLSLYKCVKDDLRTYLDKASHAQRFKRLGVEGDIDFCLQIDTMKVLPFLSGNTLVIK